jgi:murein DD-endopeptidase MepM/ murein hydrolase activator NlpD
MHEHRRSLTNMRDRAAGIILLSFGTLAIAACATRVAQPFPHRNVFAALSEKDEPALGHCALVRSAERSSRKPKVPTTKLTNLSWRWPLDSVRITSTFGERSGRFHDGIDLQAPVGTSVRAAEDGCVVFAGSGKRGYGRMVVLNHPQSGLQSVYAHLQRPLVKEGQWVSRGQKIALSGWSGHATRPHLHFEIRRGGGAIDPERIMRTGIG